MITAMTKLELECVLKRIPEILNLMLNFIQSPAEIVSLDDNLDTALRADECRIGLQPSDALRELVTALRAFNRDLMTFEQDAPFHYVVSSCYSLAHGERVISDPQGDHQHGLIHSLRNRAETPERSRK